MTIIERLEEQHRAYDNTPHGWPEEKEEVVGPDLWLKAAALLRECGERVGDARLFVDLVMMRARREGDDEQADEAESALKDIDATLAKLKGETNAD